MILTQPVGHGCVTLMQIGKVVGVEVVLNVAWWSIDKGPFDEKVTAVSY